MTDEFRLGGLPPRVVAVVSNPYEADSWVRRQFGLGDLADERQGLKFNAVWCDEAAAIVPALTDSQVGGVPLQAYAGIEVRRDPRGVIQGGGV